MSCVLITPAAGSYVLYVCMKMYVCVTDWYATNTLCCAGRT